MSMVVVLVSIKKMLPRASATAIRLREGRLIIAFSGASFPPSFIFVGITSVITVPFFPSQTFNVPASEIEINDPVDG